MVLDAPTGSKSDARVSELSLNRPEKPVFCFGATKWGRLKATQLRKTTKRVTAPARQPAENVFADVFATCGIVTCDARQ